MTAESFFRQLPALKFAWGTEEDGTEERVQTETDVERKARQETDKARAKMDELDCLLAQTVKRAREVRHEGMQLANGLPQGRPSSPPVLDVVEADDAGELSEDSDAHAPAPAPSAHHLSLRSSVAVALHVCVRVRVCVCPHMLPCQICM